METAPPRTLGLVLGAALLALFAGAVLLGAVQLAAAPISPLTVLWVSLILIGAPLALFVSYRILGLIRARYRLDRDGFYLSWGLAYEQLPLRRLSEPEPAAQAAPELRPGWGLWWPGCVLTRREVEGLGQVEFFATTGKEGWLLMPVAGDRYFVISPPDPVAFRQAFVDATRLGSLEAIPSLSERPDFLIVRLWQDLWARSLILAGLALPLLLLGYLGLRAPSLPDLVAFGFDAAGVADVQVPPGRLLLLPFIGAVAWLTDLALGTWLYQRSEERLLAYGLYALPILAGALLWGAALHLLAAT